MKVTRPEVGVLPRVVPVSTVPPRPVLSHDEGGAEVSILGELGGNPQAVGSRVTEAVVCHATSRCAQPCVVYLRAISAVMGRKASWVLDVGFELRPN